MLTVVALMLMCQDAPATSRAVVVVSRLPSDPASLHRLLKTCAAGSSRSPVVSCRFADKGLAAFGLPGAVGMPYHNQAQAQKAVPFGVRMLSAASLRGRLSTISVTKGGAPLFSPSASQNAFAFDGGTSFIVALGSFSDVEPGRTGYYACVRARGELTLDRAEHLFLRIQERFGKELRELRIRRDAWFFDVDFALDPLTLASFNEVPLPSPEYFKEEPSILCSANRECTLHTGLFRETRD